MNNSNTNDFFIIYNSAGLHNFNNDPQPNVCTSQLAPVECGQTNSAPKDIDRTEQCQGEAVRVPEENSDSPFYYLDLFLDAEIIQWLLTEINENSKKLTSNGYVTEDELRCFIAVIYLSGYLELPRRRLMWEQSPDCHNSLVSNAIRRDRFEYIMSNLFSLDEKNDNIKITELNVRVNHKLHQYCPVENQFNIADIPIDAAKAYRILCGATKSSFCNFLSTFTNDSDARSIILYYAKSLKQFKTSEMSLLFDNSFAESQFIYELKQIHTDVVGIEKGTRGCINANLSGIEKLHCNINLYRSRIRGHKVFARYFTFFLDIILYNSFLLYKNNVKQDGKQMDLLGFRRNIVVYFLKRYGRPVVNRKGVKMGRTNKKSSICESRFDEVRHYVIPQEKQTRCGKCGMKTTTRCQKCNIGVHVKCFIDFHTRPKKSDNVAGKK